MKRLNLLFIFIILSISGCYPQSGIVGYEQYNSYDKHIYIDNILQSLIPSSISFYYYKKISDKDLINIRQEYDTIGKKHLIYVYTKGIKDGYLYINDNLTNYINSKNIDTRGLEILYMFNSKHICRKEDVYKLLRIRKKKINKIEFDYLDNDKKLIVYINTDN